MIMGHVQFGIAFDKWIHGFHMPPWFMISGFFLNTQKETLVYLKRKAKVILIPYLFWGLCYEFIWSFMGNNQWAGLIWPNSIEVPLNGALWFLPALFTVDVVGFLVFKYFNRTVASLLLALLAILGCFHLISLPLSIDSALVGCGFFLAGNMIREKGLKLLKLKLFPSICLILVTSILIMLNGLVNLRTNIYAIKSLFWADAIFSTVALWNICRYFDEYKSQCCWFNRFLCLLKEIGSDPLVYVCMNQFVLYFLNKLPVLGDSIILIRIWHLGEAVVIIMVYFAINRLIKRTPLRFILGK